MEIFTIFAKSKNFAKVSPYIVDTHVHVPLCTRIINLFIYVSGFEKMDQLLHRSNIRSYSKPPVLSGELPKHGKKQRFSNAIDVHACPAHTGSGRGSEFLASKAG